MRNLSDFFSLLSLTQKQFLKDALKHGLKPVVVGGAVRDYLLGVNHIHDFDLELFGGDLSTFIKSLSPKPTEEKFGVFRFEDLQFAYPREEIYEEKSLYGHGDFRVNFIKEFDFKKAAKRRDFSINALGLHYLGDSFELLDPYLGVHDLEQGLLKMIDSEHFKKDPLRGYRGLRFAQRFNFSFDPETKKVIEEMDGSLLSPYHVKKELLKTRWPIEYLRSIPLKLRPPFFPKHLMWDGPVIHHQDLESLKWELFIQGQNLFEWRDLLEMSEKECSRLMNLNSLLKAAVGLKQLAEKSTFEEFREESPKQGVEWFRNENIKALNVSVLKDYLHQHQLDFLLKEFLPLPYPANLPLKDRHLYQIWSWLR